MAVGTGFGQIFRSVGQVRVSDQAFGLFLSYSVKVGGVAISSAVFQSVLDSELRKRIHGPDANEVFFILHPRDYISPKSPDNQKNPGINKARGFIATGSAEGRS